MQLTCVSAPPSAVSHAPDSLSGALISPADAFVRASDALVTASGSADTLAGTNVQPATPPADEAVETGKPCGPDLRADRPASTHDRRSRPAALPLNPTQRELSAAPLVV